ncbi:MAG TPA: hypothetical protein VF476_03750 [Chitinophagaceae bacterium]
MRIVFTLLFSITCISFFLGCQREIEGSFPDADPNDPDAKQLVTSSITGLILDENNQPFQGVTITASGKTVTTNAKGYFRLNNLMLDKFSSLITAEATGYFKGYRVFSASAKGTNFIKIQLLKKTAAGIINSLAGGMVSSAGYSVTLPASAVVLKSNGSAYSGDVTVFIHPIDPTALNTPDILPGSLLAVDTSNRRVIMQSFSMVAVELQGAAGEPLQIAENKTASVNFPIPSSLLAQAPNSIPLWYIDESSGLWHQEGEALKTGNNYSGEVKHFSFWNCDAGFSNLVYIDVTVKNPKGGVIPYVKVSITRGSLVSGASANGYTDSSGFIGGLVPANEPLTLRIHDECGEVVYTQQIEPLSANKSLGEIKIDLGNHGLEISGVIKDCAGNTVSNGWAEIYMEDKYYSARVDKSLSFNITVLHCNASSLHIIGNDLGNRQQGPLQNLTIGTTNLTGLIISGCGNPLEAYEVTTLAGGPGPGYLDGTGPAAGFAQLAGVVCDAQGNLYVAETSGHVIRKITPAGVVTTFAGVRNNAGYRDGPAASAQFNIPVGITIDATGNLYISEKGNHRIRKIDPGGQVTTIAGNGTSGYANGNGTSAKFNEPLDLTIDATGNLYVVDYKNYRIRKIDPAGQVTTVAGDGTSGFADGNALSAKFGSSIGGMAVDASGNIYVADGNNYRIRKITPAGIVSTFAGSNTWSYTDGPIASAAFIRPMDIVIDNDQNLIVIDGDRIRKITTGGLVKTLAGSINGYADGINLQTQFSLPKGIAMDRQTGFFYITDHNNYCVRKLRKM